MPIAYFLIFCLIVIAELYAEATSNDTLRYIFKPLIMISLLGIFIALTRKREKSFFIFLFAFIFALAGDVLLMFTDFDEVFFLLGLAAFLLTHILYIAGINSQAFIHFNLKKIIGISLVLIISVVLLFTVWGGLSDMALPVIIYTVAIAIMMISAIVNEPINNKAAYIMILVGAALFMISDSLIAINKFGGGLSKASMFIMATYISAQFYIVNGAILKINSSANS